MGILIKNFRRGFATNSSSSHSFVYMKQDQTQPGTYEDFGWNDFRLNTVREKLLYVLASRLPTRYTWNEEESLSARAAQRLYGDDFPELGEQDFAEALELNVDHQSVGTIGVELARDPRVVVFGGNDNGGASQLRARAEKEIDWHRTEPTWDEEDNGIRSRIARLMMPEKRFHISEDGNVRPCRAVKRRCPREATDHFESEQDAYDALASRHG